MQARQVIMNTDSNCSWAMYPIKRYRVKLRLRSSEAKNTGKTTEPIREFQTVPHRVVKVDSEHISTAHIEWPKGNQVRAVDVAGAISSSWM